MLPLFSGQKLPAWLQLHYWQKRLPRWAWPLVLLALLGLPFLLASLFRPKEMLGDSVTTPSSSGGLASSTSIVLNISLKFGLVLMLLYGSLILMRRWRGGNGKALKQLSILETTHLSSRQALHLVRVGKQVMLIGATDTSLTCLSNIVMDEAQVDAEAEITGSSALAVQPGISTTFANIFQSIVH
jgi:flagellar biogenesis protein FliO